MFREIGDRPEIVAGCSGLATSCVVPLALLVVVVHAARRSGIARALRCIVSAYQAGSPRLPLSCTKRSPHVNPAE